MNVENDLLIPAWPEALQNVDVVKVRFVLCFTSSCQLQPVDFLEIGRALRLTGRQLASEGDVAGTQQWRSLFQPALSDDPVARRKFQKPAPAFVITIPVTKKESLQEGDQLELEVLFIGTGIPLIHVFLGSLASVGHLGLVAGDGRFAITKVYNCGPGGAEELAWQQQEPFESLTCSVQSLTWLFQDEQISSSVSLSFLTPTRLLKEGKPLRKASFRQVFPFMLRRVTSMLGAHSGIEIVDNPELLLALADEVNIVEAKMRWHDWRPLPGRPHQVVGGFVGEMILAGDAIEEIYWVLAVAALFGVGKGATYGAGQLMLGC